MNTDATFPLPWEQVLWSSSPAFPASWWLVGTEYAFTNFRLVVKRKNRTVGELALDDIESVSLTQAWWQRAAGTSTVHVVSRRDGAGLELANIHHGPQLALVLQLRATELFGDDTRALDAEFFRSALGPAAPVDPAPASAGLRLRRLWCSPSCSASSPSLGSRRCPRWFTRTTIQLRRTAIGDRQKRSRPSWSAR